MLTPDQELDLRWYFTEARGDCGLRSAMGGQIAVLEENAGVDRRMPSLGQTVMCVGKQTQYGNQVEDRMIELCEGGKPARASRIAAVLRKLHPSHVSTLEAHFAMSVEIPGAGVSPLLVCKQPAAIEAFRAMMVRRAKSKRSLDTTPLLWIGALIRRATECPTGDEARLFGTVVVQARTALVHACDAYRTAL